MNWFDLFPLDWRTGATFVHDWFAFVVWAAVIGHIWFALADPEALRAMWRGTVSARWARTEAPALVRGNDRRCGGPSTHRLGG